MWLSRDPLALIALTAIAGILLADHYQLPPAALTTGILALSFLGFFYRNNILPILLLSATCFAFIHTLQLRWIDSFPAASLVQAKASPDHPSSSQVSVRGQVINEPSLSQGKRSAGFLLRLDSLTLGDQIFSTRHHLRVRIDLLPRELHNLAYGDRLQISGQLQPLAQARNPGAFSAADFYRRANAVAAELHCHSGHSVRRLSSGGGHAIIRLAHRSRDWLGSAITADLENDPETASIIRAMVLGTREDTPEVIEEQFRLSGALHIFAVSGLHIGLFGLIVWQLLKLLRIPRRAAIWLIIPAILFYATVTGLRPSACRAAMMGTIVLFSFAVGRRPRLINSLGLAALLLLAYNTQQLFLPGFQLSFAVLAAIAGLTPLFMGIFGRPFALDPFIPRHLIPRSQLLFSQFGHASSNYFSLSLAAWLGSLPLIIYHFQLVTPVSILANCFLVPAAMVVLSLAVMSLCTSLAQMNFISVLFNNANWLAAKSCSLITAFFASLPGGHFHFSFTPPPVSAEQPVYIAVIDTQSSGACQVISSYRPNTWLPQQNSFLIDTGNARNFPYVTHPFLRFRSINRLNSLFLTHNDHQHIGATSLILPRYQLEQIYLPPLLTDSQTLRPLIPSLKKQQISLIPLTAGNRLNPDPQIEFEILYPPSDQAPGPRADDNHLVIRMHCEGWRILLLGDAGFEIEKWLLQHQNQQLASDLIIKGHHASDLSGLEEFIATVNPQAIISSQRAFPANEQITPAWRAMVKKRGIHLFDQQQSGCVEILIGSDALKLQGYLGDQTLVLSKRKP
ncbi:MAG: ComEC/Rec2 family competence protein [Verrucomicrobiota bacterium]